jgi:glycine hydroxymethyltransferase
VSTERAKRGHLADIDPDVAALAVAEAQRRETTIDLIASESETPLAVREALGSAFAGKTAEGYPGHRYHRGTVHADALETLAIDRARTLFAAEHANVQPSSGVNANLAVYRAVLKPGDAVLSLQLAHGGHLSHGDPASITGAVYRFEHYGVRSDTELIDLDEVRDIARRDRPRLIVTGGSSYPRRIDYAAFAAIAHEVDALLLVDMAHVAGLVAAGVLPSPVPHADLVTFTTYKTMLGPHGGVILCRSDFSRKVDRAIFPGTQGAPDFGRIAAKAVCFGQAATPGFRDVQAAILATAAVLGAALEARGDRLVTGGTDNHLVLVDLRGRGITGDVAEVALEDAGILANRNLIPYDPGTADRPNGLRLGTSSIAQRGLRAVDMPELAELVDLALRAEDADSRSVVARRVASLVARLEPSQPVPVGSAPLQLPA